MQIKPYDRLTSQEQSLLFQRLFLLTPPGFTGEEQMARVFTSPMFDGGRNALTAWTDQGAPVGALGVITKDLPARGEAFLVSPLVSPVDAAEVIPALVEAAYALVRRAPGAGPGTLVRLGIGQNWANLRPAVEAAGFCQSYRILWMERSLEDAAAPDFGGLAFQPLDAEHLEEYVRVHNAAFVRSPNGAMTSREEQVAELADPGRRPELKQIGLLDGRLAVILNLSLKGGAMGEVEALAVDPDLQGRGLGRAGLQHGLAALKAMGCTRAQLTVVESNGGALRLYEDCGFTMREVQSTWFIGPALSTAAEPQPMTREDRRALAREIADRALAAYGPRMKAIGLYGSMARAGDGPFSDIEMFCVLRSEGEEFSYEWSYGPWKAEVDFYSEDVLLQTAASVEGRWPLTHGAFHRVASLYDPDGFFERLRDVAASRTDEQFHAAICGVLVGELYEFVGKWRNARASGHTAYLPALAVETAKYGAMLIGLHHRRYFSTGSRVLEEALAMPERPAGFDGLAELVISGQLSNSATIIATCEQFWESVQKWAATHGYAIASSARIPF